MADHKDRFTFVEKTFAGRGETLQAAIEAAWQEAKGGGPGTFRIVDIYFAANNPITEYSVIIGRI
jgi:hypothetical protein